MKILFITDLYPVKSGESTTPVTLHNFVIEWINQGHSVDVIKPNFIFNSILRGKPLYKTGFYEYEGVNIFNVNYFTPFWFDVVHKMLKCKVQSTKCHCEEQSNEAIQIENPSFFNPFSFSASADCSLLTAHYDLIIAHMPSGIIFANKLISNEELQPLICGVHCSDLEILTNPIYKFYFKKQLENAYRKSKKIACRSFVLKKKFNELMPECADKTFVASSGISVNSKRQTVNGYSSPQSPNLTENQSLLTAHCSLLTCANLIKRKNIDKLIIAVNDLEGFGLKIIGDGKELRRLRKLSRVGILAHQNKVEFLGRLSHEKVLEEMQKSDIFILPSINETFGMVYLEAMASGCITVCTKNEGIDGIIKDEENGFLCEPTVEGIREVLLRIKTHKNLEQIYQNSIETIKDYSQENCAKKYLDQIQ